VKHKARDFAPPIIVWGPEAAHMLGISRRTLRRWCVENRLSYVQFAQNKVGFRRQVLEHFIRQHEVIGVCHVAVVA
jgi:excisionase family DNA binding protein